VTFEFPATVKKGRVAYAVAKTVYEHGPLTAFEIRQYVDSNRSVIGKVLDRLRTAKAIYVMEWTHPGDSNARAAVWAWRTSDKQRNAPRPKPKTRTEINMDWNRRHAAHRATQQRLKRGTQIGIWAGLLTGSTQNANVN
jgi:hypothetical protein